MIIARFLSSVLDAVKFARSGAGFLAVELNCIEAGSQFKTTVIVKTKNVADLEPAKRAAGKLTESYVDAPDEYSINRVYVVPDRRAWDCEV